jgi:GT2 family glycosyltransferase
MNDMEVITSADLGAMSDVICRVSALLSINTNETARHLAEALESTYAQSQPPDQLVLVINGPTPTDHDTVISRYQADLRVAACEIIRLPAQTSLANVINAGFALCAGEWFTHITCDDVNRSDRLAVQLDYVAQHPDVDVFSSWCEEFVEGEARRQIKASTIYHASVVAALRWRNVLVPSSTLMRAAAIRDVGGYRSAYGTLAEYDLYVRLVLAGARFRVIPAELVSVRITRRGGWLYIWNEVRFRVFCWRAGFLNLRQFMVITTAHLLFQLSGTTMRDRLYRLVRRPAQHA